MKLSEILGWRKKDKIHLLFNGRYSQVALETALSSCDREIDREALAKICHENSGSVRMFSKYWDSLCEGDKNIFRNEADAIISTMPTWLKRIEDK